MNATAPKIAADTVSGELRDGIDIHSCSISYQLAGTEIQGSPSLANPYLGNKYVIWFQLVLKGRWQALLQQQWHPHASPGFHVEGHCSAFIIYM